MADTPQDILNNVVLTEVPKLMVDASDLALKRHCMRNKGTDGNLMS